MPTLHALAIDVETTGLDPQDDRVVELAAIGPRHRPARCAADPLRQPGRSEARHPRGIRTCEGSNG